MVKSNEQLGLPIQEAVDSIDLQTPGLTTEQDERLDTLVDSGFNYTEARRIAGVETTQSIAKTALANTVHKPKKPYSWQRSRKGYSAAELRIADGPPEHIAREIRGK
ncbi:MAG: hypothetical protein ACR2FM_02525 [Candidatus Saccharimonadales bacterium]